MIRGIVTDIEGTTSDIHFVHQVLFPYARQHLRQFIYQRQQQEDIQQILNDLRQEIGQPYATADELINVFLKLMDEDKKSTVLKTLQGLIWREGYLAGEFRGHLYSDVLPAFHRWRAQGIALYIYSSGSVTAQKLLFTYSEQGNVSALLSGYFDTEIGHKQEVQSYHNIARQLDIPTMQLLFLSDIHQELDAAYKAGWQTRQLSRNQLDPDSQHVQVASFHDIQLEGETK